MTDDDNVELVYISSNYFFDAAWIKSVRTWVWQKSEILGGWEQTR